MGVVKCVKLSPHNIEFIIFGQKPSPENYLIVWIFVNHMHPAVFRQKLCIWFYYLPSLSIAHRVCNICKSWFLQVNDLRWVGSI